MVITRYISIYPLNAQYFYTNYYALLPSLLYCYHYLVPFPSYPLTFFKQNIHTQKKRKNLANKDHSIIPNFPINVYRKTVTNSQLKHLIRRNQTRTSLNPPLLSPPPSTNSKRLSMCSRRGIGERYQLARRNSAGFAKLAGSFFARDTSRTRESLIPPCRSRNHARAALYRSPHPQPDPLSLFRGETRLSGISPSRYVYT